MRRQIAPLCRQVKNAASKRSGAPVRDERALRGNHDTDVTDTPSKTVGLRDVSPAKVRVGSSRPDEPGRATTARPLGPVEDIGRMHAFNVTKKFLWHDSHCLMDTMYLIKVTVEPSLGIQQRDGAKAVFKKITNDLSRVELIRARCAHAGEARNESGATADGRSTPGIDRITFQRQSPAQAPVCAANARTVGTISPAEWALRNRSQDNKISD